MRFFRTIQGRHWELSSAFGLCKHLSSFDYIAIPVKRLGMKEHPLWHLLKKHPLERRHMTIYATCLVHTWYSPSSRLLNNLKSWQIHSGYILPFPRHSTMLSFKRTPEIYWKSCFEVKSQGNIPTVTSYTVLHTAPPLLFMYSGE